MGDLTKNFSKSEFVCKCGCGSLNIDEEFLCQLQKARENAGFPWYLSSGCRCPMHNKKEGGTKTSDHIATESIQCCAADIICYNSGQRFQIVAVALKAGFTRIGIDKSLVHLGYKGTNPQNVIWLYSRGLKNEKFAV